MAVTRELVQNFFAACMSRDPARVSPFLDDDVEWSITGPIDLLPFCGERRGKSAVLDTIVRIIPSVLEVTALTPGELLIEGDRAASFMNLTAKRIGCGRTVSYRCAQFLRFRNNRLVELRGLIDSFDAVEQVLGRPIAASASGEPRKLRGNLAVL